MVLPRISILVVDDDPFLATTLASALKRAFPSETSICVAHSLREAMGFVQQDIPFRVAIVDHELPDGKGADFLKTLVLRRGRPIALFLVSGADPDQIEIASLLRELPQITFVEKPFRYQELVAKIRDTILPEASTDQHFYGLKLFELIQAYSLSRRSMTIRVLGKDEKMGVVFLREGEMIHATMDRTEGLEALTKLARSRHGKLRIEEGCFTAKHSIELPTMQALLEVFRRIDENAAGKGQVPWATPNPDGILDEVFKSDA